MEQKSINPKNIEVVKNIKNYLQDAKSIIFVDYKGLTVQEETKLRKNFRENKVNYFVAKNRLLKIAIRDLSITGLDEYLIGPTAVAVSKEDEVIPAKLIDEFAKNLPEERNLPKFKFGIVDNSLMNIEGLNKIVKLPPKRELLAKIVGGINSPITGIVFTLNGILQKLVIVLNQIKNKKQ
ncbi:MAG: 50S ribosomal protein L10 [Candidatus Cloacimonetes bacterium]|nr:50S ribosomal protein L10 [Candidatus Cloacimonadota bacterium]MBL7085594.1 50S ribosomal protein L10 [Candidatus Cloacimonadota bacterium]